MVSNKTRECMCVRVHAWDLITVSTDYIKLEKADKCSQKGHAHKKMRKLSGVRSMYKGKSRRGDVFCNE